MYELKMKAALFASAIRLQRANIVQIANACRVANLLHQLTTDAQRIDFIRGCGHTVDQFTDAQCLRIAKRWQASKARVARMQQALPRMQRWEAGDSYHARCIHLARMVLKGTPLAKVEDPKRTHPRPLMLFADVLAMARTARGDWRKPEGYNGTFKQFFDDWLSTGVVPPTVEFAAMDDMPADGHKNDRHPSEAT